ncbi:MAG: T9SS type A sorting domain-containing protein [bacterium]
MHKLLITYFFLTLLTASQITKAQTPDTLWTRTYLGYGRSVCQLKDSGFVTAGYVYTGGPYNIYLIKTNPNGDKLWEKTYGGSTYKYGYSVCQTKDDGFVIAGSNPSDIYLLKTDSNGDTLWTRAYGSGCGYSVCQTADSGLAIVGFTDSFGDINGDVYLIKTNPNGDTLWTKTYGGSSEDLGCSVSQTVDGGFIIVGRTMSFGAGNYDVYLIRTDSSGDTLWTRTYGGSGSDEGSSVQQTFDDGYIVTGRTFSFSTGKNIYLIKTNSNGDTLWTRAFNGSESHSVCQTTDSGFVIAGARSGFYFIKVNANGDILWTKNYGGGANGIGYSVQQTYDEGLIVAGCISYYSYLVRIICNPRTNEFINPSFDMTPWDTGWVKYTHMDSSIAGNGHAMATSVIQASNSAVSPPRSCNLRTLISCGHDGGTYGEAYANASASINQTFKPISNCLIKASVIDTSWGVEGNGYSDICIYINGNWEEIYRHYSATTWAEICTTVIGPVSGIRFSSYSYGGFTATSGWSAYAYNNFYIDDIQITEVGVEEQSNIETPSTTLRASPNPFVGITNIKWSAFSEKEKKIRIYDISGKLLEETKNNIIGKDLKSGIYFVKVDGYKPIKVVKTSYLK